MTGLHYLRYEDDGAPAATGRTGEGVAEAGVYVLAAHAVENARILLNTGRVTGRAAANSSGLVGRHLMDHPVYLAWGLMPPDTPVLPLPRAPVDVGGRDPARRPLPAPPGGVAHGGGQHGVELAHRRPLGDGGRLRLRERRERDQPGGPGARGPGPTPAPSTTG